MASSRGLPRRNTSWWRRRPRIRHRTFGPGYLGGAAGILSVDRYSAYKTFVESVAGRILLAFCWQHVRRDYFKVGI
ncbi:MAG: transposase, partial [Planctomycetota bacterium]